MAYGYPYDATGALCYGVGVDVYDLGCAWRGAAAYLHTEQTSSATIYIQGSWAGAYTNGGVIGSTVAEELDEDCAWTDPHLHQYSTAGGWYKHTGVYPDAPDTGTGWDLTDSENWQNRTSWTY